MEEAWYIPDYSYFSEKDNAFELIEDEIIDIEELKEFEIDENNYIQTDLGAFKTRKMDIAFLNKINELIVVAKQLNNEIQGIKERK